MGYGLADVSSENKAQTCIKFPPPFLISTSPILDQRTIRFRASRLSVLLIESSIWVDFQVSRTSIRPFKFTSNTNPSTIEILVRTGRILPVKKPARSEKGLQDVASRDGFDRPVRLAPVLQDPMLNKFEPDPRRLAPAKLENPGKEWVAGLNALGGGTVVVAQNVVQVKETKRIDWEDPKNLVLFRYRCGKSLYKCWYE